MGILWKRQRNWRGNLRSPGEQGMTREWVSNWIVTFCPPHRDSFDQDEQTQPWIIRHSQLFSCLTLQSGRINKLSLERERSHWMYEEYLKEKVLSRKRGVSDWFLPSRQHQGEWERWGRVTMDGLRREGPRQRHTGRTQTQTQHEKSRNRLERLHSLSSSTVPCSLEPWPIDPSPWFTFSRQAYFRFAYTLFIIIWLHQCFPRACSRYAYACPSQSHDPNFVDYNISLTHTQSNIHMHFA